MADLHISLGSTTSSVTTTTLLNHLERIHSLYIGKKADLVHALEALKGLRYRNSRLTRLDIQLGGPFHLANSSASSIAIRQFDWEVLPLPNLTHLSLGHIFLPFPITVSCLLLTLQDMPNLESFKLCSDIIAPTHHSAPLGSVLLEIVRLLRLSSFQIRCQTTHHQVIYLLDHLRLPQLIRLGIECHSQDNMHSHKDSDYTSFMRAIMSTISSGDFSTCDMLVVCFDQWFHLIPREHSGPPRGLTIDFIEFVGFDDSDQNFTLEVLTALKDQILSRLVRLDLADSSLSADIFHLFGRLPSVDSIEIEPEHITTLTKALSIPACQPPDTPLQVLPKLEEITLAHSRSIGNPQTIQAFCDALKMRYQFGTPIRKSYVDSFCVSKNSVLRLLGEIGVEVNS